MSAHEQHLFSPSTRSNIKPDKANANHHSFQMYTFDKTTNCKACKMFLRWVSPACPTLASRTLCLAAL